MKKIYDIEPFVIFGKEMNTLVVKGHMQMFVDQISVDIKLFQRNPDQNVNIQANGPTSSMFSDTIKLNKSDLTAITDEAIMKAVTKHLNVKIKEELTK